MTKYEFIDRYCYEFGIRWLFRRLHILPNAYYNYRKHKKRKYEQNKYNIYKMIKEIYYNNNQIIGHRSMVIFLARNGIVLSKTTVHKYMNKVLNLHSIILRKSPRYTKQEKNKVFQNLLNQNFITEQKNKVWCTDFTYIRLGNGKIRYNCSIIDLYDRSIVSSVNSNRIGTSLAIKSLSIALANEHPKKGLILHSDQGVQFTSFPFVNYCKNHGIIQSMSKSGCPYDNAPMERFYRTFKQELIYRQNFHDEVCFYAAVNKYVFLWYNHVRPHSFNSGLTPFQARFNH